MSETIKTDSPSTGKTIPVFLRDISIEEENPTIFFEANDFAVPLRDDENTPGVIVENYDGEDRQIVDGEALFITPLTVSNGDDTAAYVSVWIDDAVNPDLYKYVSNVYIPGQETVQIGVNGFSLVKNNPERARNAPGPKMLLTAENADVKGGAVNLTAVAVISEAEAGTHAPAFRGIF
jgi:hypothetical protein